MLKFSIESLIENIADGGVKGEANAPVESPANFLQYNQHLLKHNKPYERLNVNKAILNRNTSFDNLSKKSKHHAQHQQPRTAPAKPSLASLASPASSPCSSTSSATSSSYSNSNINRLFFTYHFTVPSFRPFWL